MKCSAPAKKKQKLVSSLAPSQALASPPCADQRDGDVDIIVECPLSDEIECPLSDEIETMIILMFLFPALANTCLHACMPACLVPIPLVAANDAAFDSIHGVASLYSRDTVAAHWPYSNR